MSTLKSMTGYAVVQREYNEGQITCEIRSLNSRFLEIVVKLPRALADLENPVRDLIRKKIFRGKLVYSLTISSLDGELQNLRIDPSIVKVYKNLLDQLREASGIESPITLEHLLSFKEIITFEEESRVDEELSNTIMELSEQALTELNQMRQEEGAFLAVDIENHLKQIALLTDEIYEMGKDNPKVEFEKLYKRTLALIGEEKLDISRLEQEIALISDKVDITEEAVRMKSHIQLFENNLKAGSPIGKRLNFILQEMHREANTMSNKATLVEISHRVVSIKEAIEKIREQIQNIE
ncbi:MAG: YicC family protein [Calditrichia bacterium]